MFSLAIATMIEMMESLPETVQDQVVELLFEYMTELQDEIRWESLFPKTQSQLPDSAPGETRKMDYT